MSEEHSLEASSKIFPARKSSIKRELKVAASIMCADLLNLERDIMLLADAKVDLFHIDIMDGHFVPNIALGIDSANQIAQITNLPREMHLLVGSPDYFIDKLILCNLDTVIIRMECKTHLGYAIDRIRKRDAKVGVAINPETKLDKLIPTLGLIDQIVVMTVNPGFSGQTFIESTADKVRRAYLLTKNRKRGIDIEVDGGISFPRIRELQRLGANIFVAGTSTIFRNRNISSNTQELRKRIEKFLLT